jgi:hypothetical protein
MSQVGGGHAQGSSPASSRSWMHLFRKNSARAKTCSCGEALPPLEQYLFTFLSGAHVEYCLAQCPRCLTMFWDPASPGTFVP